MRRQHAAVGLADVASGASTRVRGCCGEHLRGSEPPGDEGGGAICGRRWRLPGDAVVKLDVGLGLAEEVPVGHRPEACGPRAEAICRGGLGDERDDP